MKTYDLVFYGGVIVTLIIISIVAFIASAISSNEYIDDEENPEDDNSDVSHLDYINSERPWVSCLENHN
jgi:hypothetical protein